jgi:hypothetical protein
VQPGIATTKLVGWYFDATKNSILAERFFWTPPNAAALVEDTYLPQATKPCVTAEPRNLDAGLCFANGGSWTAVQVLTSWGGINGLRPATSREDGRLNLDALSVRVTDDRENELTRIPIVIGQTQHRWIN